MQWPFAYVATLQVSVESFLLSRASPSTEDETPLLRRQALIFPVLGIVSLCIDVAYLGIRFRHLPSGLALASGLPAVVCVGIVVASTHWANQRGSAIVAWLAEPEPQCVFAVFSFFLVFFCATGGTEATVFNQHVRQAEAFLHGRAWLPQAPKYIEHVVYQGHACLLHPPLPAILLMPLVAIWGARTNQTAFSIFVGAIDLALTWRLLRRLGLSPSGTAWLTCFFGLGTIIWMQSILGNAWTLPMVVAIAFTLPALTEVFGKARPVIVGLFAGLAALARYDLAFVWPVYVALLYVRKRSLRELVGLAPGFLLATAIYAWFNESRFGTFFDIGIDLFSGQPPFGFAHLPYNLYTVFMMAPAFSGKFPWFRPKYTGQSLLLTSPAFFLALRPSFRQPIVILMALAALIAMTPSLFFFTNGFLQFGTRHYVHAFPFLLVMVALGLRRDADQLTKIFVVLSVICIAYGVWYVRIFGL